MNPIWKQLQDKISKDQSDSKKMPSKATIYSPPSENIQKQSKIRQKVQPIIMPPENIETKNYDMACFMSSVLIEGEINGFVIFIDYFNQYLSIFYSHLKTLQTPI